MDNSHDFVVERSDRIRRVLYSIVRSWWVLAVFVLLGSCLALGFSFYQDPVYRASATLYVTSGNDPNSQSAYQGSLASQQRVDSYVRLVSSEAVLRGAVERVGGVVSVPELRSMVSATASPATVLLTVNVDDKVEGRPILLANSVSESLTDYVRSLEEPAGGGPALAKLTVVSPATSQGRVSPQVGRNAVVGGLAGLIVGFGVLWLRARLDNRIRGVEDLELRDEAFVLGAIPASSHFEQSGVAEFADGADPVAESYRRVRTNVEYISLGGELKSILVTSAAQGDGKTTTAVNLAVALAEAGERVLLVDADLRRPSVARVLGLAGEVGLSTFLRGDSGLADVVQAYPGNSKLDILASGEVPPNASVLLTSEAFRAGLREFGLSYDRVILDCPPVLPVADAVIAGNSVDGVVVVVRAEDTRRSDLADTLSQLSNGGAKVVGVVINVVASSWSGYGYRQGYYASDDSVSLS